LQQIAPAPVVSGLFCLSLVIENTAGMAHLKKITAVCLWESHGTDKHSAGQNAELLLLK
jgi:hypothetical protein